MKSVIRHCVRVRALLLWPHVWRLTLLLAMSGAVHMATTPAAAAQRAASASRDNATVHGVLRDSISGLRVIGALVQLVSTDTLIRFGRTETSDSLGAFEFADVPGGRYAIGFYHPMLDSLGLEPITHTITVGAQANVRADLGIPSAATLRVAICGPPSAGNAGGVLIGTVFDAKTHAAVAGVTVAAQWYELAITRGTIGRRAPRRVTTTKESGWYAICQVPKPGNVALTANRSADSTDIVDVQIPPSGLMRRDLYLGAATIISARGASATDTGKASVRTTHVGDGRLTGRVVAAATGGPLPGALVSIASGPQTRTDARGEWTINDAPTGTRTLEVRAVGHYPVRQTVDIVDGAPAIRVMLSTFQAVLDTMRVRASVAVNPDMVGFEQRRRSGLGRFLTQRDIEARLVFETSEVFRSVSGVYVDTDHPEETIQMRGITADRCKPDIYINGHVISGSTALQSDGTQRNNNIGGLTSAELNAFVRTKDILGVEVYSSGQAPPQFMGGMTGCGSIVFWTK
jgi:hypothetical protein